MNAYYHVNVKMNNVKEIDIKNCTYYFHTDIINIKNLDPNNLKTDEKSYKNILIYYIRYVQMNSINLLVPYYQ